MADGRWDRDARCAIGSSLGSHRIATREFRRRERKDRRRHSLQPVCSFAPPAAPSVLLHLPSSACLVDSCPPRLLSSRRTILPRRCYPANAGQSASAGLPPAHPGCSLLVRSQVQVPAAGRVCLGSLSRSLDGGRWMRRRGTLVPLSRIRHQQLIPVLLMRSSRVASRIRTPRESPVGSALLPLP